MAGNRCLVGLVFLLLPISCTSIPYLARPDAGSRISQIKNLVVLPPRVDLYEVGFSGARERKDEWSDQGARYLTAALNSEIKRRRSANINIVPFEATSDRQRSELADIQGLLTAVNLNVLWHVYGSVPERFPDISQRFDISLGPDFQKLEIRDADAFVVVSGVDHISTPARIAREIVRSSASGPLGMILDPFKLGQTWVSMALVDARTGEILWYRIERSFGGYDVRDAVSVKALSEKLLAGFPIP